MTTNEAATEQKRRSTPWHDRFGALFKLFDMPRVTIEARFYAAKEMPVGDVKLVLKDGMRWTEAEQQYLPDGVRDSIAYHKLLELKYTESFNKDALEQTIGYNIIYRRSYSLSPKEVASFLLVSRTPHAATLTKFGYKKTAYPGVYQTDTLFASEVTLIVLNQLSDAPHNAYVKLFASKKRVKRNVIAQLKEMGVFATFTELSEFVFKLAQLLFQEEKMTLREEQYLMPHEMIEAGKELAKAYFAQLTPEEQIAGLDIEHLLGIVPPEQWITKVSPKQRVAGLTPEEVLSQYKPKEVLSQYKPEEVLSQYKPEEVLSQYKPEEVLSQYKPEEIERYLKQLKKKQSNTHETSSDS